MKLKICGIRNKKMVDFCNSNKIDYAGFNFVGTSKRRVKLSFAKPLVKQLKTTHPIALFMDQRFDKIAEVLSTGLFPVVQFHGQENVKLLQKIKNYFPEVSIIKVFSEDLIDVNLLKKYKKVVKLYLFDGNIPGSGETIKSKKNINLAVEFCEEHNIKYGIAGGINASNIRKFREKYASAYFLDTASGVEENKVFSLRRSNELVENFQK